MANERVRQELLPSTRSWGLAYAAGVIVLAAMLVAPWVELLLGADGRFRSLGSAMHAESWLIGLYLASDLVIGLASSALAVTLIYLVLKADRGIPFLWAFVALGIVIFTNGLVHLAEALTLWTPVFWGLAGIKLVTALISLATALVIPLLVPQVLALIDAFRHAQHQQEQLADQAELLDLAYDGIFVRDLATCRLGFWNRGAEEMYGWTVAEALGHASHELLLTRFPIPRSAIEAQVVATGRWEGELVHTAKDGHQVVVSSRWALQTTRDGQPAAILEINRDVTEERQAEDALRKLASDLEQRVADRTSELQRTLEEREHLLTREQIARQQAEDALRLRDEFISVASHELKTPITALQLQVQLLELTLKSPEAWSSERLATLLTRGARQLKRLSRLNNDLLDASRISVGRPDVHRQDIDLVTLVRDTVTTIEHVRTAPGPPIAIHAPETAVGCWDPIRLEQVFTNLLENALKFGLGKPVEISVAADDRQAVCRVRDHGLGIDPTHFGRIFERFERAVPAQNYGGLGLGLYLVRQIVIAHGGHITVDSEPGAGATFTVVLPLRPPEQ